MWIVLLLPADLAWGMMVGRSSGVPIRKGPGPGLPLPSGGKVHLSRPMSAIGMIDPRKVGVMHMRMITGNPTASLGVLSE